MSLWKVLAAATLMISAGAAAAQAADTMGLPAAGGPAAVSFYEDQTGFDWDGFYAGVFGVAQSSPLGGVQYGLGIDAGFNRQFDFVLVGGEIALQGLTGAAIDTVYGQILGRAGLLITDEVLIYAAAGLGIDLGTFAEDDLLLGGGLQVAVAEDWSLRAQYLHGFALSGANPKDQITLGAHFHF
jgi:outer membrane immunogenic protein